MELIANNSTQIIPKEQVITNVSKGNFIEANTVQVSLNHLKNECTVPVFSRDNELTISHYQFINRANEVIKELFPEEIINEPNIRVSHIQKGRVPSAIGKPVKELLEQEKTIFYERCAFIIELPEVKQIVNGNELTLTFGGVRSLHNQNLYSKKSLENFQFFVGFKTMVCCNLAISTDGFSKKIRIASIDELEDKLTELFSGYNSEKHLGNMEKMSRYQLSEKQFAHFIGKLKMFQHIEKNERTTIFPTSLNDSQINTIVKDYYNCQNFGRSTDGSINLWNLYNLFTEANKSSYIDSNFERNVNAYELINNLVNSIQNEVPNWLLSN